MYPPKKFTIAETTHCSRLSTAKLVLPVPGESPKLDNANPAQRVGNVSKSHKGLRKML